MSVAFSGLQTMTLSYIIQLYYRRGKSSKVHIKRKIYSSNRSLDVWPAGSGGAEVARGTAENS
jgi:hypothetical protein